MTALEIMTGYDMFKERFLRLPRELRDLVSANVHRNSAPVFLERIDADPAILVLFETEGSAVSPEYRAEVLEAFYTHSTFNFTFPASGYTSSEAYQVQWGPHPQFVKYIRRLYVHADELDPALYLQHVRYDRLDTLRFRTKIWERLLELPRLEQLTIRMQKRHACYFSWADFGPILVHLRENMPRLQTTFSISFDAMFERFGRDPIWEVYTEPWVPEEEPYDPKGFLDVSELIKAPTQEDFRYVQENCAGQKETPGKNILAYRPDHNAEHRRVLALDMVVEEPALMRVLMINHYEVYKAWKMTGEEADNYALHRTVKTL